MTAAAGTASLAAVVAVGLLAAVSWSVVGVTAGPAAAAAGPLRAARAATWCALAGAAAAVGLLEWALLTRDFGVRYVAEHGGHGVSTYFTVTSLWAALEGSVLLWLLVLAGYTAVAAHRVHPRARRLHPWVLVVLSLATAFFAALALVGGNPFGVVDPVPADGPGPNPLLQNHWLMALHPPLLYLGYVGLAVPFAYALAALVTGETGRGWLLAVRRWTLVAWGFLTAGIVMGAWWAYAVLGWGGYWAWDPVENASLLPWLTATALLHSLAVQERRATLRVWNVTLAIASFVLVLLGTFLTRSGVVDSVHAFSTSALGPVLLGAVVVVLAVSAALLVWRADRLGPPGALVPGPSRETALLANNLVLVGLAGVVLLGTTFPVLVAAATGDAVAVGPPYYTRTATPLALVLLLLMAVGPLATWGGGSWRELADRLAVPACVAAAGMAGAALAGLRDVRALLAVGLAGLVVATAVAQAHDGTAVVRRASARRGVGALAEAARRSRRVYGGLVAHVGVAGVAVAVAVSSTATLQAERQVAVGETLHVGGWSATLTTVERQRSSQAMTVVARLALARDGAPTGELAPRLRAFPAHGMVVAEPAVRSRPAGDVYATVTGAEGGQAATVRLAVNPLVPLLWASGAVMVAGAALAGWPSRRRWTGSPALSSAAVPSAGMPSSSRAGRPPVAPGLPPAVPQQAPAPEAPQAVTRPGPGADP